MNGWTPERKLKQQEAIHRWKPWNKSTGPRTANGRANSSQNAVKTGQSSEIRMLIKVMNQLLRNSKHLL